MSGRLIILPKKSWHPGKRENIEKVLRDERLAAEEAAAARERAREIAQEGIVETLSKKRSSAGKKESQAPVPEKSKGRKRSRQGGDESAQAAGGKGQGWGATLQHVNLFSEAEREAGKVLGQNADHQREKREQDLQKQQRSGLAPTALGEGSAELRDKDSQPWYTQASESLGVPEVTARTMRLGREVTGEEAAAALKRDVGRKGRADPMGFLFRSGAQATAGNLPTEKVEANSASKGSKASINSAGFPVTIAGEESDRAMTHSNDKKRSKKFKKSKKHKKKDRNGKRRSAGYDGSNSRGGSASATDGPQGDESEKADDCRRKALEDLRRRRLAREGGERERQIRLLAEREMAGKPLPDDRSRSYNNQYNAPAARQNRGR